MSDNWKFLSYCPSKYTGLFTGNFPTRLSYQGRVEEHVLAFYIKKVVLLFSLGQVRLANRL